MTTSEAEGLITWLAATTSTRLLPGEITVWIEQMRPLDVELATKAVAAGREHWGKFPSWKEFRAAYRSQKAIAEREAAHRRPTSMRRDVGAPEWIHVWYWTRTGRRPRNLIAFPQQGENPDAMTVDEYEKMREEWIAAGSPKARSPIPLARSI